MKYKVFIKQCADPENAANIAEEVAKLSGSKVAVVAAALMQNNICIRTEADEQEYLGLRRTFEVLGANVIGEQLMELPPPPPPPPSPRMPAPAAAVLSQNAGSLGAKKVVDDDDDDGPPGHILTEAEFCTKIKTRKDIFEFENDRRGQIIEIVCVACSLVLCYVLASVQFVDTPRTDFFDKLPDERGAKIITELPTELQEKKEEPKKEAEEIKSDKKKLVAGKKGSGGSTGGGGDPRARVTQKGVLGIISGQVKGKSIASADVFGKGGFATGIDAILSGVGGLQAGGSGGVGRKGAAGIGYGSGYGSGFGGGGGGIGDLIGGLMEGDGGGSQLSLKKKSTIEIAEPTFTKGGALTGGRSMAEIRRVVMQNIAALKYAYNKRLRDSPGLKGRVTVKFAIDEFGNVVLCLVESSTMNDASFEQEIVSKIKRWAFGKIDKPGDITECVYPFVFNQ